MMGIGKNHRQKDDYSKEKERNDSNVGYEENRPFLIAMLEHQARV